ncbi:hypothetical protein HWV62_30497 [Athelia sp. TMB]|nr:hypothetical protein HWV62_30497 [Athelia sp. TMB]
MSSFAQLLEQNIHVVPEFTLECGRTLREVPVAYKTWGALNAARDNVMIICHAFTGSADVEDWWGPMLGPHKAFDPTRFFIICLNVLGSPYGSASPLTPNPATGLPYGPAFPRTTVRDDVRIHRLVLDALGIARVAVVVGGSMGGMAVLEWPLCHPGYVRRIVPLATSARHSAWCISWGEAQRQAIYSDPDYEDGYYPAGMQPASGLAAARMTALLTYRSRDSFESRFGRKPQPQRGEGRCEGDEDFAAHNEGHRKAKASRPSSPYITSASLPTERRPQPIFSAQSYLRYQGAKFTARFDANCYIHITRKLDTHDIARSRPSPSSPSAESTIDEQLALLPRNTLVFGIETDGLFTIGEQRELAGGIPGAELVLIESPDGHDGFLLEFKQINARLCAWLRAELPELYKGEGEEVEGGGDMGVKKASVFGEAEAGEFEVAETYGEPPADVARW